MDNTRSVIEGVKIIPLRQIVDERGKIMHMLKATDPHFIQVRRDLLLMRLAGRRQGLAHPYVYDRQQRSSLRKGEAGHLRSS